MTQKTTFEDVISQLNALANPANVEGQKRFGINAEKMLGISMYDLRKLANGIRDHELALKLWETGILDARMVACMVDDPKLVTPGQMETWVADFDSWAICDTACDNLFAHVEGILEVIPRWAEREEEYVRRAAFATMAVIAWYEPLGTDEEVARFFPLIMKHSNDPRNFVKKAVNWALRNIGKKRVSLRAQSVACAQDLSRSELASARWIGKDALREFEKKFGPLSS